MKPQLAAELYHVRLTPGTDLRQFPDFLLIGPHRTGTTWLHRNLWLHPQVLLAHPKELYFFDRLKTPEDPRYHSNDLAWYLSHFRDTPRAWAEKVVFHLLRYGELYRPRVRGEATASYAVLDRDVIEEIVAIKPGIRVVVLVRDPIERAWSHAKKDLGRRRGRSVREIPDAEFRAFFSDPYQLRLARYGEIIDRWSEVLAPGHVFTGRFDDIRRRPEGLLQDLFAFLGIRGGSRYTRRAARREVNRTESTGIPEQHRAYLHELLHAEIDAVKRDLGGKVPAS